MPRLANLISDLDELAIHAASTEVELSHITEDSRDVRPGSLFIARPGVKVDGRRFINAAIERGAAAILTDHTVTPSADAAFILASDVPLAAARLAERFFDNPSKDLLLIGVTGTNGKTTITHLIHSALEHAGTRCGLIGTIAIADHASSTPASLTTPSAIELSRNLAAMRDRGCRAAALEVSSHALHQRRAAALDFDVAIFTNLTGDHLDYHKTLDDYAAAKALLFEQLSPDALAIVNALDPAHRRMLASCKARALTCATHPTNADYTIIPGNLSIERSRATLETPTGTLDIDSPLVGAHNLMNLAQAAAALDRLGMPLETIARALAAADPPPGRLEPVRIDAPAPFTVLVDYAHTDDALASAIRSLRPFAENRLTVLFGCGGDRDRTKRPRMARAAASADRIIITSDNPRTEQPDDIIAEIVAGLPDDARPRAAVEPDREFAIHLAIETAEPGDIVLIAGKGHETYQLLPDANGGIVRRDFDDREVARRALAHRFAGALTDSGATP